MDKTNVNPLIHNIENELSVITEKGLSSSNFDTCYRLVDMLYKLQMIQHSSNQKCSCYDSYTQAKKLYRTEHTDTNQNMIITSVKEYMAEVTDTIHDMLRDCDCATEKDIILNYISNI